MRLTLHVCTIVCCQDGGDPFNYQDDNLGWMYRAVAAGSNHTAALIQVRSEVTVWG